MILANDEVNAISLIAHDVHVTLTEMLRAAAEDPSQWGQGWNYSPSRYPHALSCLMKLSQWPEANMPLRSAGVVEVVSPISKYNHIGGLVASIIVVFLIGSEEKPELTVLLHSSCNIIERLIDLLDNTVHRRGDGKYYNYGYFSLEMVLQACYSISLSDRNRCVLATAKVRDLLQSILDNIEYTDANQTVFQSTLKLLFQLSFIEENDERLQLEYFSISTGIKASLIACKTKIPTTYDLIFLNKLLARLSTKSDVAPLKGGEPKHVMLSYCWSKLANSHLAALLATALREQGYEVWRDVEGSALLRPMSGSTDDVMAEAVERSYAVVICVSKEYKRSTNCRLEANYSSQRQKQGKLKIMYVMMQEHYTTVSSPDCCDGYLGLMIGGSLWYPLFEESMVATTTQLLVKVLGDHAKASTTASHSQRYETSLSTDVEQDVHELSQKDPVIEFMQSVDTKLSRIIGLLEVQDQRLIRLETMIDSKSAKHNETLGPREQNSQSYLRAKYTFEAASTFDD